MVGSGKYLCERKTPELQHGAKKAGSLTCDFDYFDRAQLGTVTFRVVIKELDRQEAIRDVGSNFARKHLEITTRLLNNVNIRQRFPFHDNIKNALTRQGKVLEKHRNVLCERVV